MAEYRAIYKCRLCGRLFENGITGLGHAAGIAGRLTIEDNFSQGNIYGCRHITHNCEDGSFGFADYQGLRKVDFV